jgi:hypothetical protein
MSKMLPMLDPFDEIKRLYFSTTAQTIERDIERALDLLTQMPDDEARDRVAGYMHGLAELRREWKGKMPGRAGAAGRAGQKGRVGKTGQTGPADPKTPKR